MKVENTNLPFTALGNQAFANNDKLAEQKAIEAVKNNQNQNDVSSGKTSESNLDSSDAAVKKANDKIKALYDQLVGLDQALVIEKNPNNVGFIYKTVDKETGKVLSVWPRDAFINSVTGLKDSGAISTDNTGLVINSNI